MGRRRIITSGYNSLQLGCTGSQRERYYAVKSISAALGVPLPQRVLLDIGLIQAEQRLRDEADRRGIPWKRLVADSLQLTHELGKPPTKGQSPYHGKKGMSHGFGAGFSDDPGVSGIDGE